MKYGKLKRSWQFDKVYKEGEKYYNDLFVLYVLPNRVQETRIGLTVTKKVGISVQRNRIKRLIREVLRSFNGIETGNDIVVIARKATTNLKLSQVRDLLADLLYRARVLNLDKD